MNTAASWRPSWRLKCGVGDDSIIIIIIKLFLHNRQKFVTYLDKVTLYVH